MGRKNSIGFLRLLAASFVIVGHSVPFGGFGKTDLLMQLTHNQLASGRLPVDVFFVLSGFLIAASFDKAEDWRVYMWHRILRIYPGFLVCITLTGILLAPLFGHGVDLRYIAFNAPLITGIFDFIPGMFAHQPYPSVNGALWTLPWELRAYVLVALLGGAGALLKRRWWVPTLIFFGCWSAFIVQIFTHPGLETSAAVTSGLRLFSFFFAGTCFYVFRDRIPVRWELFVISVGVMTVGTIIGILTTPYSAGVFYAVAPIPLTYAALYLGMRMNITEINSSNDRSYGIYIYGTLVLNIFVYYGLNHLISGGSGFRNWIAYLLLAYTATYVVASLSWFLIEGPAMRYKPRQPWRRLATHQLAEAGRHQAKSER